MPRAGGYRDEVVGRDLRDRLLVLIRRFVGIVLNLCIPIKLLLTGIPLGYRIAVILSLTGIPLGYRIAVILSLAGIVLGFFSAGPDL